MRHWFNCPETIDRHFVLVQTVSKFPFSSNSIELRSISNFSYHWLNFFRLAMYAKFARGENMQMGSIDLKTFNRDPINWVKCSSDLNFPCHFMTRSLICEHTEISNIINLFSGCFIKSLSKTFHWQQTHFFLHWKFLFTKLNLKIFLILKNPIRCIVAF